MTVSLIKILILSTLALVWGERSAAAVDAERCQKIETSAWTQTAAKWQGRELVAFASWCSSCKEKILNAAKDPDNYVFMVAFDDVESSTHVLKKLNVESPCVYGDDLVAKFDVKSLPWSKKI